MAIKGQNIRISLSSGGDTNYLAAGKNCSFHGSANIEDVTTKDTPTGATEQEFVSRQYDMSSDALVVYAADAATWLDAVGKEINFSCDLTTGSDNKTQSMSLCTGKAIINDVSLQAQDRSNATIAIQATTTGTVIFNHASTLAE